MNDDIYHDAEDGKLNPYESVIILIYLFHTNEDIGTKGLGWIGYP